MENSTSRIIIETVVKKALRDVKDSPERSIRNLVDMALHFSNGRFQHSFFEAAQTMLQNEHSPYYGLIEDMVAHVDSERLLRFGMNLGYNGCTIGAKTIREIEEKERYNIPWMISLYLDPQFFAAHQQQYHDVILQGERMGVYTWMLLSKSKPQRVLPLVQEHPDSAFVLFCKPEEITQTFLEDVCECNNLMLAVRYEENAADACNVLRNAELLYSVYYRYTEDDVGCIINGDLFCSIEQLHPLFTALIADPDCSDTARATVYEAVKQARNRQLFQTVTWETDYDSGFIDGIISNESCVVSFDAAGYLLTLRERKTENGFNIMQNTLSSILKRAFPKSNAHEIIA